MPDDQPQWTPVGQPCDADLSDTDLYRLGMAQSHWLRGRAEDEVTFELFVRSLPKNRGYLVVAGLADALSFLERFHLADEERAYLAHLGFRSDFLAYLSALRFTGTVRAIPEASLIGAQYPILSVTAPRIQAEIVESVLLSIIINHQTMVASKAARIVHQPRAGRSMTSRCAGATTRSRSPAPPTSAVAPAPAMSRRRCDSASPASARWPTTT